MKSSGPDITISEDKLSYKSKQITQALFHKKINKIIFSQEYLDLIIGCQSGETLTVKNYLCPLCEEWCGYDKTKITKQYEDQLLGITIEKILFRKTTFYQENIITFSCDIYNLHQSNPIEICGFLGPVIVRPLHKTKKKFLKF